MRDDKLDKESIYFIALEGQSNFKLMEFSMDPWRNQEWQLDEIKDISNFK
jgi:hypothetical protein